MSHHYRDREHWGRSKNGGKIEFCFKHDEFEILTSNLGYGGQFHIQVCIRGKRNRMVFKRGIHHQCWYLRPWYRLSVPGGEKQSQNWSLGPSLFRIWERSMIQQIRARKGEPGEYAMTEAPEIFFFFKEGLICSAKSSRSLNNMRINKWSLDLLATLKRIGTVKCWGWEL